ncbi:hypothetical protein EDB92DRAFT_1814643 [Lactarius akahatsu]|uniref:Uncharacterized protein n=1 Tax=Lactarius akahatsu TaxID=416441 RepID=A0AAD4LP01_9AGAM|nr:hypothetical protein EDB92DRAFT_1814643 [Lactarius akahatsu]
MTTSARILEHPFSFRCGEAKGKAGVGQVNDNEKFHWHAVTGDRRKSRVTTPKTFEQCVVVRVGYMCRGFADNGERAHVCRPRIFSTHPTTIIVRFPAPKKPVTPGLGQLLGGGNDFWKEKGLTLVLRGRWAVDTPDSLRCDEKANRFGRVEEDNRLILQSKGSEMEERDTRQGVNCTEKELMVNKLVGWGSFGGNSHHHLSLISSLVFFLVRRRGRGAERKARSGGVPAPSRNEVAIVNLKLVLVKQLENDILQRSRSSRVPVPESAALRGGFAIVSDLSEERHAQPLTGPLGWF